MRAVVYGASGRLGESVVRSLARMGADVVPAGGSAAPLASLATELALPECRVIAADDKAGLVDLLQKAHVVVHCAAVSGETLVEAALATGTGYVDAVGDQGWIRRVYGPLSTQAKQAGVILAPAHGVDYALGDVAARLALREVDPAEEVVIAYAPRGSGVAAGSARFASETLGSKEIEYRNGDWRQARWSAWQFFDFPDPVGRRQVTRYGSGEVVTIPRHSRVASIKTSIVASALVPHPALQLLLPLARPVVARLRRSRFHSLAARLLRLGSAASQVAEPDGGELTLVATARAKNGRQATWIIEGIGFRALSAELLSLGSIRVAERSGILRGALSASQLFDPEELLGQIDVQWRRGGGT